MLEQTGTPGSRGVRGRIVPQLLLAPMLLAGCVAAAATVSVSTGTLSPAFSADVHDYSISSLNSLAPITVTATEPGATISINGQHATSGVATTLQLVALEDIVVDIAGETYTVHYLPPNLPGMTITSTERAGDEPILLTPSSAMLLIIDRAGRPLYYRTDSSASALIDFERTVLPDIGVTYSYLRAAAGTSQPFSSVIGERRRMNAAFEDIGAAPVLAHGKHGALAGDGHDFVSLTADHYIAMSYVAQTVDTSAVNSVWSAQAQVVANIVQEVQGGEVVLEWTNTQDPSLYFDSVDGNLFDGAQLADYTHLNSIDVDPSNGNLILSLRHANTVLEVDRHTGATLWKLGGLSDEFGLSADQLFSHQHYVRKQSDGSLLLFDNGNGAHQTRVLELAIDEAAHELSSFRVVHEKPADQPQSTYMGSAVRLATGRYLIGWGGYAATTGAPAVTEVVDGVPVWTLAFDDPSVLSYRAVPAI